MRAALGLLALFALACREPPRAPFTDVTGTAGLGGPTPSYDAALADFDGDGRIDVYLGNHGAGAALLRNRGGARFENVIAAAGLAADGDQHGAGWGDVDGDGRPDLYVALGAEHGRGVKRNRLYRNTGAGPFEDTAEVARVTDPRGRARGVTWVDYDRDGRLDLFVANYATPNALYHNRGDGTFEERAAAAGLARPGAVRAVWTDYDHDGWPDVLFTATPQGLRLLRNRGDGTFGDVTDAAGLARTPAAAGAAFADADGDGDLDLFLAAGTDFPVSVTLRDGVLTFAAIPGGHDARLVFATDGARPPILLLRDGMPLALDASGVSLEDEALHRWRLHWNGTGRLAGRIGPGVTAANALGVAPWRPSHPDRLYVNQGNGTFLEQAARAGLTTRGNGQAVAWADVDNDGDLDLWVVRSGVEGADEPDVLYLNDGRGRFTATEGYAATEGRGCGADFADLDGDGRLDLLLTTGWGTPHLAGGAPRLLLNTAPPAHWLAVDLVGRTSNRPGLGAWVELRAGGRRQVRYRAGGGLYSQSWLPEHFGLGGETDAEITVTWPSGTVQTARVAADQTLRIVESGNGQ